MFVVFITCYICAVDLLDFRFTLETILYKKVVPAMRSPGWSLTRYFARFYIFVNDLKTICDVEIYVDDTILWESCNRSGNDSNIQTAADQAVESDQQK